MVMQSNGVFRGLSAPQYPFSSIPEWLVNLMWLLSCISISVCSGEQVCVNFFFFCGQETGYFLASQYDLQTRTP